MRAIWNGGLAFTQHCKGVAWRLTSLKRAVRPWLSRFSAWQMPQGRLDAEACAI